MVRRKIVAKNVAEAKRVASAHGLLPKTVKLVKQFEYFNWYSAEEARYVVSGKSAFTAGPMTKRRAEKLVTKTRKEGGSARMRAIRK